MAAQRNTTTTTPTRTAAAAMELFQYGHNMSTPIRTMPTPMAMTMATPMAAGSFGNPNMSTTTMAMTMSSAPIRTMATPMAMTMATPMAAGGNPNVSYLRNPYNYHQQLCGNSSHEVNIPLQENRQTPYNQPLEDDHFFKALLDYENLGHEYRYATNQQPTANAMRIGSSSVVVGGGGGDQYGGEVGQGQGRGRGGSHWEIGNDQRKYGGEVGQGSKYKNPHSDAQLAQIMATDPTHANRIQGNRPDQAKEQKIRNVPDLNDRIKARQSEAMSPKARRLPIQEETGLGKRIKVSTAGELMSSGEIYNRGMRPASNTAPAFVSQMRQRELLGQQRISNLQPPQYGMPISAHPPLASSHSLAAMSGMNVSDSTCVSLTRPQQEVVGGHGNRILSEMMPPPMGMPSNYSLAAMSPEAYNLGMQQQPRNPTSFMSLLLEQELSAHQQNTMFSNSELQSPPQSRLPSSSRPQAQSSQSRATKEDPCAWFWKKK